MSEWSGLWKTTTTKPIAMIMRSAKWPLIGSDHNRDAFRSSLAGGLGESGLGVSLDKPCAECEELENSDRDHAHRSELIAATIRVVVAREHELR